MKYDIEVRCILCSESMVPMLEKDSFSYFFCKTCRQVSTFPYPSQSQIEDHYRHGFQNKNYRVVRENKAVYYRAMEDLCGLIQCQVHRRGRALKQVDLLDIGCFTGEFLVAMQTRGARVWGVELQEQAVEIAKQRLPGKIFQADVLRKDFTLPVMSFDIVTLLGVIEHVTHPLVLLERVHSLLKDTGIVVIQTPNVGSALARIFGRYWPPYTPIEHIHLFSHKSLALALTRIGFSRIRFIRHCKMLSPRYVYGMFNTFGTQLQRMVRFLYAALPRTIKDMRLPFYVGEIVVIAEKARSG